jgi:hypothetical protein
VSFQDRLLQWADAELKARQVEVDRQDTAQKDEQTRIASNLRRARRTFISWEVEQTFRDVESALRRIHGTAPVSRAKLSSRSGSLWISATAGIERAWAEQEQRMHTAAMIYLYLAYDGRTDILTIKAYGAGVEANQAAPLSDWTRARLESVLLLAIGASG